MRTTVAIKDSAKETSAKTCAVEKNTKAKPAMTGVNLLMNVEPAEMI